ncbi:MAG: hypothetical protein E7047_07555 [Lentisphaerae bacterium]|nr:hypothetical protein [Lentisphaerota bacterium]
MKENSETKQTAVMQKADELYNKLPLDKINDKLGGKIDVKSKKFKLIAASALLAVIIAILCIIFFGGSDPKKMSTEEFDYLKEKLAQNSEIQGPPTAAVFVKMEDGPLGSKIRTFKVTVLKNGNMRELTIHIPTGGDFKTSDMEINGLY